MEKVINETMITEAALSDSVLFQSFNSNAEMTSLILSAIKDSIVITSSHIEEQLMQINRTRISPLVDKVMEAFEEGSITLLYSKTKRIPKSLPFFATKVGGRIKVFIFTNNYGSFSGKDLATGKEFFNIAMKDLYVLMEGAYTAYQCAMYPIKINKNLGLMKLSCNLYTTMIIRILNREYALSMDQDTYDKVSFCVAKFFLKSVWNCTNSDVIFSYAKDTIKHGVNVPEMLIISKMYDEANINTIEELITFMKGFSSRLKPMNFRYFVQCYINLFKDTAMFSLECLPYFLFTVESAMLGSFIVNQPIMSDIIKNTKGMNNFYPELVKAIVV